MQTYRLISVLNQYYKLYTAILSKRIEEKLPFLIDKDQTGFTECRQTQDSLRRTFHTVEHIKKEKNKLTYPTQYGCGKKIDSVGWNFSFIQIWIKFVFQEMVIKGIKTLYTFPIARIKVNGVWEGSIHLQRGCHQGCPASPVLFNRFIETLAKAVRQNPDLEGTIKYIIKGIEHKICLYADVLVSLNIPESGIPR